MTQNKPLCVCYFGTYRQKYARNQIMIEGLRQAGVEVFECHETLWHGIEDRVQIVSGGWLSLKFLRRVAVSYFRLLRRYFKLKQYDILIVGYPGQYDVFLARFLSWIRRKPLVWDVLNSMYLIMLERQIAQTHRFTSWMVKFLERLACHLPDLLILDCMEFVTWFQKTHHIQPERFRLVPIGADIQVSTNISILNSTLRRNDSIFKVLYFGTFIPNHGTSIIVESARYLINNPSIQITLIGRGLEHDHAVKLAEQYGLPNVKFIEWLNKEKLNEQICQSDVCLGSFGATQQALVTNNNKIYEGFSFHKPVITGISPAMPKILIHNQHLILCERGNPQALANAILILKKNPALCKRLGENGYRIFEEEFNGSRIGKIFSTHLEALVHK